MVAHHHGVEFHGIHDVKGGFSPEKIGPGFPLKHIPRSQ
jgi:hypothetical protein